MNFSQKQSVAPHSLRIGDIIGIVAPSGPFDESLFERGIELIHGVGFGTKIASDITMRHRYLAGDDHHRAVQFNAMVADDDVQAVMCARGGYGAMRVLELLDYDAILAHRKPLIGFSDATALHQAIRLETGLVTFHGPMVTTLANADEPSREAWLSGLTEGDDVTGLMASARVLKPGSAEGVLTGGNLATLCHLVGTPYGASYKDTVLLLEDVGEAPYRLDRMLTQMRLAGVLAGLAGIMLGQFEECGSDEEIEALFLDRFADMDIPIVAGVQVGHGRRNLMVPLGGRVRLDSEGPVLTFLEPVFKR